MRISVLSALALFCVSGCDATTEPSNWKLVWEDDFTGVAGASPNSANWKFDVGTDWGNNQLEFTTSRPVNASLDGSGNLLIVARQESFSGRGYTSARMTTEGKRTFKEGRFEARIKVPSGQGIWPAFWLLGANTPTIGWPQSGEIDIMEFRGQEPNVVIGSVHGPGYSGGNAISRRFTKASGSYDTNFHTYRVDWTADRIRWYVDDEMYKELFRGDQPGTWVYDHPFYIILNLAVGGNFVGAPNGSTTFPSTMTVDWVRVYQAAP